MTPEETEILGMQMTCAQAIEFLAAYLNQELLEEQHRIFEAHLAICQACRDYLASYQTTIQLAQNSQFATDVPSLPEDLIQAILVAQTKTEH